MAHQGMSGQKGTGEEYRHQQDVRGENFAETLARSSLANQTTGAFKAMEGAGGLRELEKQVGIKAKSDAESLSASIKKAGGEDGYVDLQVTKAVADVGALQGSIKGAGGASSFIHQAGALAEFDSASKAKDLDALEKKDYINASGHTTNKGRDVLAIPAAEKAGSLEGKRNTGKDVLSVMKQLHNQVYNTALVKHKSPQEAMHEAMHEANEAVKPFMESQGVAKSGADFWGSQAELKAGVFTASNAMALGGGKMFSGVLSSGGQLSGDIRTGLSSSNNDEISSTTGTKIKVGDEFSSGAAMAGATTMVKAIAKGKDGKELSDNEARSMAQSMLQNSDLMDFLASKKGAITEAQAAALGAKKIQDKFDGGNRFERAKKDLEKHGTFEQDEEGFSTKDGILVAGGIALTAALNNIPKWFGAEKGFAGMGIDKFMESTDKLRGISPETFNNTQSSSTNQQPQKHGNSAGQNTDTHISSLNENLSNLDTNIAKNQEELTKTSQNIKTLELDKTTASHKLEDAQQAFRDTINNPRATQQQLERASHNLDVAQNRVAISESKLADANKHHTGLVNSLDEMHHNKTQVLNDIEKFEHTKPNNGLKKAGLIAVGEFAVDKSIDYTANNTTGTTQQVAQTAQAVMQSDTVNFAMTGAMLGAAVGTVFAPATATLGGALGGAVGFAKDVYDGDIGRAMDVMKNAVFSPTPPQSVAASAINSQPNSIYAQPQNEI